MLPIYSLNNVLARWKTTLFTAGGFMLVVAAMIVMLAFYNGIKNACTVSGEPQNVLVLSQGLADEIYSKLDTSTVTRIANLPPVLRGRDGRPLASRELFLVITERDPATGAYVFLEVRGVTPVAFDVHRAVKLTEGRMFQPGKGEVVIGRALQRQRNYQLGDVLKVGNRDWIIVGTFDAGGSAFESEAWSDIGQLSSAFRRDADCSVLVVRVATPSSAHRLAQLLKNQPSLGVEALVEPVYYIDQAKDAQMIQVGALIIAVFMAIGAVFGAMNTMFASVSQREKEVAVLRILGFSRRQILTTFLAEGLVIAIVGGAAGILLGQMANGWSHSVTVRSRELAFEFDVSSTTVMFAAAFSIGMGVLGGLLPAWSATRISPLQAMR